MGWSFSYFYRFSGLHALLTGLLPFYLPVILWRETGSLTLICSFIAVSGLVFMMVLPAWEALRASRFGRLAVAGSFVAEGLLTAVLLVADAGTGPGLGSLALLAVLNGLYGCFYWLSVRVLFVQRRADRPTQGSGHRFGNFQLLVGVLLKLGILGGAVLLEKQLANWLLMTSVVISLMGFAGVYSRSENLELQHALALKRVSLAALKQGYRGRWDRMVFVFDGLFLFMESYFWVLSLYRLTGQSLGRLGMVTVVLAVALSVIFLLIKSRIDRADSKRVFALAVGLYSLSWALRGWVSSGAGLSAVVLSVSILLIAFMTSFFRLAFNKRFFDQAGQGCTQALLLAKSWYSQGGVVLSFGGLALVFWLTGGQADLLPVLYWLSAPVASIYLLYLRRESNRCHDEVLAAPTTGPVPAAD